MKQNKILWKIGILALTSLLMFGAVEARDTGVKVFTGKVLVNGEPSEGVRIEVNTFWPKKEYETYTNKAGKYNIRVKWHKDITYSICAMVSIPGGGMGGCNYYIITDPSPQKKDFGFGWCTENCTMVTPPKL